MAGASTQNILVTVSDDHKVILRVLGSDGPPLMTMSAEQAEDMADLLRKGAEAARTIKAHGQLH